MNAGYSVNSRDSTHETGRCTRSGKDSIMFVHLWRTSAWTLASFKLASLHYNSSKSDSVDHLDHWNCIPSAIRVILSLYISNAIPHGFAGRPPCATRSDGKKQHASIKPVQQFMLGAILPSFHSISMWWRVRGEGEFLARSCQSLRYAIVCSSALKSPCIAVRN